MSRLDRYLLSQLLLLFGFFSLVLVGVYWVNRAVSLFDQLIGDGQSAVVFLEFTALSLPSVIRLVLPVSAFIAAIYVTNRLSAESELVVVLAAGLSPARLARPVLVFGLCVAGMMLILTHILVPVSRTELGLRSAQISQNITSRFLVEGAFIHPAEGVTLYVRQITLQGELLDVFLFDGRDRNQQTSYTARRALLVKDGDGPKLIMFEGLAQTLQTAGNRLLTTTFKDLSYDIGSLVRVRSGVQRAGEMSTLQLFRADPADLTSAGQSKAQFLAEAHQRFVQPLLAIVAAVIGYSVLMLGAFSRLGKWRQIVLAVTLLILMQLIGNQGLKLAQGDASLWLVAYAPVVFGTGAATLVLWAAGRNRRVASP